MCTHYLLIYNVCLFVCVYYHYNINLVRHSTISYEYNYFTALPGTQNLLKSFRIMVHSNGGNILVIIFLSTNIIVMTSTLIDRGKKVVYNSYFKIASD